MLRLSTRLAVVALIAFVVGTLSEQSTAQAPQGGVTALTGVRIIDGTGRAPVEQGTILIANGRIAAAGASSSVQAPAGATRVDLAGKTIIPGMINAHAHVQNQTKKRNVGYIPTLTRDLSLIVYETTPAFFKDPFN